MINLPSCHSWRLKKIMFLTMITLYQSNIICCALRYLQVQKKCLMVFFAILGLFQDSTKTSFVEVYFFFCFSKKILYFCLWWKNALSWHLIHKIFKYLNQRSHVFSGGYNSFFMIKVYFKYWIIGVKLTEMQCKGGLHWSVGTTRLWDRLPF